MAQRTHCDICDARVTETADHLWPNLLPANNPLRSVTVTLAFFKGQNQKIDLCWRCRGEVLRGIVGVLPEPSTVTPKEPEPIDGALADRGHP